MEDNPSMSKWTKTRRDPGRTYLDEDKIERKKRMLEKAHELLDYGTEEDVKAAAKAANPDITTRNYKKRLSGFATPFPSGNGRSITALNFFSDSRNCSESILAAPLSIISPKVSRKASSAADLPLVPDVAIFRSPLHPLVYLRR
jgi:hypothetical protein